MRSTAFFFSVVLLFGAATAAAQMTPADAFNEGKASGSGNHVQGMFDDVNNTNAANVVTGYSQTPPVQSSYWGGGATVLNNLLVGGSGKITECAGSGLNAPNPADKQHCEAVESIRRQPSIRPTNLITNNDPLLLMGKAIAANPDAIAGAINSNYSSCTTTIKQNDPAFTMETCNDWSESGAAACTMGQQVVVDPDYLYRCSETLSVINTGQCTVGTVVTVDADSNYQCNRTEKAYQTYTCDKTAVVVVGTLSNATPCTGEQARVSGAIPSQTTLTDHAAISCAANPDVFSIFQWTTGFGICSITFSAPANGVTVDTYCNCGSWCWRGRRNRITCVGDMCTWVSTAIFQYAATPLPYPPLGTTSTSTFSRTQTTSVPTASVTWTDQCAALQARTQ